MRRWHCVDTRITLQIDFIFNQAVIVTKCGDMKEWEPRGNLAGAMPTCWCCKKMECWHFKLISCLWDFALHCANSYIRYFFIFYSHILETFKIIIIVQRKKKYINRKKASQPSGSGLGVIYVHILPIGPFYILCHFDTNTRCSPHNGGVSWRGIFVFTQLTLLTLVASALHL